MQIARALYHILALSLALWQLPAPAFGGTNPWKELSPGVRSALQRLLPKNNAASDETFKRWYRAWHCAKGAKDCRIDREAYAEYSYNHLFTLTQRVSATCVLSKVLDEFSISELERLGVAELAVVGDTAALGFNYRRIDSIIAALRNKGYGEINGAHWGHEWGLRSSRSGAQLHWKQSQGSRHINVHIDLRNPGTGSSIVTTVRHVFHDLTHRDENYRPAAVINAMGPSACGLGTSDLLASAAKVANDITVATATIGNPGECL